MDKQIDNMRANGGAVDVTAVLIQRLRADVIGSHSSSRRRINAAFPLFQNRCPEGEAATRRLPGQTDSGP